MRSGIKLSRFVGIATDLVYLFGLAALLLACNPALEEIGLERYWTAVALVGLALLPVRYVQERCVASAVRLHHGHSATVRQMAPYM